jgi:hypothetical protein
LVRQQPSNPKFGSSKPTVGKALELENFLLKFLDHEVRKLKLKLFSQQDLVDKTPAQQPKVQQFESTEFQDPHTAAAETSGSYYYSSVGKLEGKGGRSRKKRGKGRKKIAF